MTCGKQILSRANPCALVFLAHGLVFRAHGLVIRAHELVSCAHGLLNRAHVLLQCHVLSRFTKPCARITD